MITETAQIDLLKFGERLQQAKHGMKKVITDEALAFFGWNNHHKLYNELKKLGWTSGKKTRVDAGKTAQDEEALLMLAAVSKTSSRANGKILLETPTAISVLSQNGFNFLSPSSVNKKLRERNLTAKQMKQETSHGHFRTEHPNHVHQVDPSLCVLYYPPNTKKGMTVQSYTTLEEHYKNKPEALEKIVRLRVWRYVMVDHASGLISVYYYESAGENQKILYDFLLWCWGKLSGSPFHGLPRFLYWDKGSANTSKTVQHAMDCLGVEHREHTVHLSRAKGAVEKANDMVEKLFEGRLFLEPVNSVAELNEKAIVWQNAYNANLIPNYNAKHNRHGKARNDAWLMIMQADYIQHLRELPCNEYCRYIFTHKAVTRTVSSELEITFVHPVIKKSLTYSVADLDGIFRQQKILVSPIVIGDECKVLVTIEKPLGENVVHELAPLVFNELGFRVDSPVFGEGFDTKKDSVVDTNQKEMDRLAFPGMLDEDIVKAKAKKITPFNGEIDALSHIHKINLPAAITPKGASLDLPSEFQPTPAKPLSPLALKRAVLNALGRDLEPEDIGILAQYTEVYEDDVARIVAELLRPKSASLKLVNN